MALKLKRKKAHRPEQTTTEPVVVHSIQDPAIGGSESSWKAYTKSLDANDLEIVPGESPARFEIIPLNKEQRNKIRMKAMKEAENSDGELARKAFSLIMCQLAFDYGCRAIHGIEDEDGNTFSRTKSEGFDDIIEVSHKEEIGSYVLRISEWEDDRVKK